MSRSETEGRAVEFEGQTYTLLYEHVIGPHRWTTAYRFDALQHVHLLHRFENEETGEDSGKTLYLHFNDVKMIFLNLLQEEMTCA